MCMYFIDIIVTIHIIMDCRLVNFPAFSAICNKLKRQKTERSLNDTFE